MTFFEEDKHLRIRKEESDKINYIVSKMQDKYENESHFIRCAVIRLIAAEMIELRKRS